MFATKQESRGALSAETDSENRNTLTNPLTWRDRQMWVVARAPRVSHRWRDASFSFGLGLLLLWRAWQTIAVTEGRASAT